MSLVEILSIAETRIMGHLPLTVGGLVALTLLMYLIASRRRRDSHVAATVNTNRNATNQSYADRRGAIRRDGPQVRVLLASNSIHGGAGDGVVIDRSTGGLKIAAPDAIAPGSTVKIRTVDAPETIVTVTVRSCRESADHYELGCEFDKTPPWTVLQSFG